MADTTAGGLVPHLRTILAHITKTPYPILDSPETCKKRASVAFILRIRPSYAHWPEPDVGEQADVDSFFGQDWVQHGEPEVLFIKRASRKGDRWTSQIALPGGKRDSTDADDRAAAVREAWEEVGVDVTKYAIDCGNLPQRIVTTHWGKKPLLVLCPYVFLITSHDLPPLRLQPSEVASTHWVPLKSLLSPSQRTIAFEDVSNRIANEETGVKRWMLSMILGKMMFAAIDLAPVESLHCIESPEDHTLQDNRYAITTRKDQITTLTRKVWQADLFNQSPPSRQEGRLLLWGLTLGVVSDFLDLLPPHNALDLWTYPTFTPLDVRFSIWLLTYNFKNRKRIELQSGSEFLEIRPSFGGASESGIHSIEIPEDNASTVIAHRPDETGLHGLGTGSGVGDARSKKAAVATMLEGYYELVRRAVRLALIGRISVSVLIAWFLYKRYRLLRR